MIRANASVLETAEVEWRYQALQKHTPFLLRLSQGERHSRYDRLSMNGTSLRHGETHALALGKNNCVNVVFHVWYFIFKNQCILPFFHGGRGNGEKKIVRQGISVHTTPEHSLRNISGTHCYKRGYDSGIVVMILCMLIIGTMMAGCGSGSAEGRSSSWSGLPTEALEGIGASVTAVTGSSVLIAGKSMPVVVYVKDRYGHAVADGTAVSASSKLGSSISASVAMETKGGFLQCTVTAGQETGVETLTFASPQAIGSISFQITNQQEAASVVRVAPVADSVKVSGTLPVVVFVANAGGIPLNSDVRMFCLAGGTFKEESGTASGGVFVTEFTAPADQGVCWISAIVDGRTASTSVAVLP